MEPEHPQVGNTRPREDSEAHVTDATVRVMQNGESCMAAAHLWPHPSPAKRRRSSAPLSELSNDSPHMFQPLAAPLGHRAFPTMENPSVNPGHNDEMDVSIPVPKVRQLTDLPLVCLRRIFEHVIAPPRSIPPVSSNQQGSINVFDSFEPNNASSFIRTDNFLSYNGDDGTMQRLLDAQYLRHVCHAFRNAYDHLVTRFDFSAAPLSTATLQQVCFAISRFLPRCVRLRQLVLTQSSTDHSTLNTWTSLFDPTAYSSVTCSPPPSLQSVVFADVSRYSHVPEVIARASGENLLHLHVGIRKDPVVSASILSMFAMHCSAIRCVDVVLDGVDSRVLAGFGTLQVLRALFRTGVSANEMRMLVWALGHLTDTIQGVDLRIHASSNRSALSVQQRSLQVGNLPAAAIHPLTVPSSSVNAPRSSSEFVGDQNALETLECLPLVPRLRKLSLFGWISDPAVGRALAGTLQACLFLQELQLEWCEHVHDEHIEELMRLVGARLKRLRIWNCEALTDYALLSIAQHSDARALIDLRFESSQFSPRAVAALGQRAHCETWTREWKPNAPMQMG